MKKEYRILVLTDHSGHSDQNSIYAILSQLMGHPRCHSIDIASRGLKENDLFFNGMQRSALFVHKVTPDFKYSESDKYYKSDLKKIKHSDYDIVLMRLPRPISDDFLYWVEEVFSHAVMINKPKGIIHTSNKKYLLNFPDICPDTRLCHSVDDVNEELCNYPIVLKPLREYGGRGLLKIDGATLDDGINQYNTELYLEKIKDQLKEEGMLSMRYLKNVSKGDKRILVVGGEILASSLRLPREGSWICNVAQGGKSVSSEVTSNEVEIIKKINPHLKKQGILIYGVDTLLDDNGDRILSEINTLSIGGFPQAEFQTGKPIIHSLINKIIDHTDEQIA